jgi:hypothetical protein
LLVHLDDIGAARVLLLVEGLLGAEALGVGVRHHLVRAKRQLRSHPTHLLVVHAAIRERAALDMSDALLLAADEVVTIGAAEKRQLPFECRLLVEQPLHVAAYDKCLVHPLRAVSRHGGGRGRGAASFAGPRRDGTRRLPRGCLWQRHAGGAM